MKNIQGLLSIAMIVCLIGGTGCGRNRAGQALAPRPVGGLGALDAPAMGTIAGSGPLTVGLTADLADTLSGALLTVGEAGNASSGPATAGTRRSRDAIRGSNNVEIDGDENISIRGDNNSVSQNTTHYERSWIDAARDWWNSSSTPSGTPSSPPPTQETAPAPRPPAATPAPAREKPDSSWSTWLTDGLVGGWDWLAGNNQDIAGPKLKDRS